MEGWRTEEGHKSGTAAGPVIQEPGWQWKCVPPEYVSPSLGIYQRVSGICCDEPLAFSHKTKLVSD